MGSSEKWYLTAAVYSDITLFIILTGSLVLLFAKLGLRVDATGVVTLAIFWLSVFARTISSIQIQEQGLNGLTVGISLMYVQLVWSSLYFFTFELRKI
jgi:hypothetical protein